MKNEMDNYPIVTNEKVYKNYEQFEKEAKIAKSEELCLLLGNGLPLESVVYAFKNEKEMNQWASRTAYGKQFEEAERLRKEAMKKEKENHEEAIRIQLEKADQTAGRLEDLAERTGLKVNSKELFIRATSEADVLEGSAFDPALIFDGTNFRGRWRPLFSSLPVPALGWIGMNNRTSSVIVTGILHLFDLTWFRGSRVVIWGIGTWDGNLPWWINNRASSAILI